MKPQAKPTTNEIPLLATMRLDLVVDLDHDLVRLAGIIPWEAMAEDFVLRQSYRKLMARAMFGLYEWAAAWGQASWW